MYGNELLDANGHVKTNEKHHGIVLLDKMLRFSRIPHVTEKMFDGWKICYPAELIGHGRKYTVRQHSLSMGEKNGLVELWDNDTDEIKAVSVMQAYAKILAYQIGRERESCV